MESKNPTDIRLATIDKDDLKSFVVRGIFTNLDDAACGTLRKGIEQIKKKRGFQNANET
ncbi:MAG: hypothetical protein JXA38_00675 [Methanosarcinaceae archaeon]|nr:hypothetical protein [Methanosarcinaceae archaeon]